MRGIKTGLGLHWRPVKMFAPRSWVVCEIDSLGHQSEGVGLR